MAIEFWRADISYHWIHRLICNTFLKIQLPALLHMHDYSPHKCTVPALYVSTSVGAIWGPSDIGIAIPILLVKWGPVDP